MSNDVLVSLTLPCLTTSFSFHFYFPPFPFPFHISLPFPFPFPFPFFPLLLCLLCPTCPLLVVVDCERPLRAFAFTDLAEQRNVLIECRSKPLVANGVAPLRAIESLAAKCWGESRVSATVAA
jgi:hypothetical protein